MRLLLALLLLTACGGSSSQVAWKGLPELRRSVSLVETVSVEGIEVSAEAAGAAGLALTITNKTDEPVTFDMAKSTFQSPLVADLDRVIPYAATPQERGKRRAPAVVDAKAPRNVSVMFLQLRHAEEIEDAAVRFSDSDDVEERNEEGPDLELRMMRRREILDCIVNGGTLTLSFTSAASTRTWTGHVNSATAPAPARCQQLQGQILGELHADS